jgi:hypothetical protein
MVPVVCPTPTPALAACHPDSHLIEPVNVQLVPLVLKPGFETRFVAMHWRQHVATLQVDPGTHVLEALRRWWMGHAMFWLPQVTGVPTQTLPWHWSFIVAVLKSLQAVPLAAKIAWFGNV